MPQREHHDLIFNAMNVRILLFSFLVTVTKYLAKIKLKEERFLLRPGSEQCNPLCSEMHASCSLGWLWQLEVVHVLVKQEAKRDKIVGTQLFPFYSGQDPSPW